MNLMIESPPYGKLSEDEQDNILRQEFRREARHSRPKLICFSGWRRHVMEAIHEYHKRGVSDIIPWVIAYLASSEGRNYGPKIVKIIDKSKAVGRIQN